jgi:hypothetical protein
MNVTVVPPGQVGHETVEVTVTVVVGQIGQGVVAVGYGHGPVDCAGAGVGPLPFGDSPFAGPALG